MAKKGNLLGLVMGLVAIGLAVLAICMMFAPAITGENLFTGETETGCNGWQVMFGWSEESGSLKTELTGFNVVAFLALIFAIAGGALGFIGKEGALIFASIAAFVVAGILFFLFEAVFPIAGLTEEIAGIEVKNYSELIKNADLALGAGPIVAGIACIGGAVAAALKGFVFKK